MGWIDQALDRLATASSWGYAAHGASTTEPAALAALALVALILAWRKRRHFGRWSLPDQAWFLRSVVIAAPLGFIAIEAGWTVTEVGRQPFIITGIMRTAEAVTPVPYLTLPLSTYTLVYLFLAFVVVFLLLRQFRQSPRIVPDR